MRVLGSHFFRLVDVFYVGSFLGSVFRYVVVFLEGYVLYYGPRVLFYVRDMKRTTSYGTFSKFVSVVRSLCSSESVGLVGRFFYLTSVFYYMCGFGLSHSQGLRLKSFVCVSVDVSYGYG